MVSRCYCYLALVLGGLALAAPAARAQPDFVKTFERDHKKALADGNYDIDEWNGKVSEFIHRCISGQVKSDYAIELCENILARARARNAYGDVDSQYAIGWLVKLYRAAGKDDRAIATIEELIRWHKEEHGEKNQETIRATQFLLHYLLDAQRYDRAIEIYQKMIAERKEVSNEKLGLLWALMSAYEKAGKLDQEVTTGETILEQISALDEMQRRAWSSRVRMRLANGYTKLGKKEQALNMIEGDWQESKKKHGVDHPETIALSLEVADRYAQTGQPAKAIPFLKEAVEVRKKKLGADDVETLRAEVSLAYGQRQAGNSDEAIKIYAAVLPRMREKLGAPNFETQAVRMTLCESYEAANRPADAEPLWRENVEVQRQTAGPDSYQANLALAQLGTNLLKQEKWPDAEKTLAECLTARRKREAQLWSTFNSASQLGGALLGQKKYKEAEPLLLEGYQGMKQRENFIPPQARMRITEAVQRLVKLYEETDRKEKADDYRKLLPPAK